MTMTTLALTTLLTPGTGFGEPRVTPFLNGAEAAISLEFDDSMKSQVENALPLLRKKGIRATFFINPGASHYQPIKDAFERQARRDGHELGNHTWRHVGANTLPELESEVQKAEAVLNKIYGKRPRLKSFAQPGGVPWTVTPYDEAQIFRKYRLISSTGRHFFEDGKTDPRSFVQAARREKSWKRIGFHGIGGEWLPTSVATLTTLLDDLNRRPNVWTAPTIEIHKYLEERRALRPLKLRKTSPTGFELTLACDPAKLETYGLPLPTLWDQDLTIELEVPQNWRVIEIRQGTRLTRREVGLIKGQRLARFEARPNRGKIEVKKLR